MGYCYTREAALFLLADGMGGHAEGEVAAQLALQSIAAQFQREAQLTLPNPSDFLRRAVMTAHRHIQRYAKFKRMADAPRTTLVAAVVQNGTVTWLHCGDSRLYWVRRGQLLARTRDHSYSEMEGAFRIPRQLVKSCSTAMCCSPVWGHLATRFLTSAARITCAVGTASCCARTGCGACSTKPFAAGAVPAARA